MDTKYFKIGGFTIQVNSELPIGPNTFHQKFNQFEVRKPGNDLIVINHYFNKRMDADTSYGDPIYQKRPWKIYQQKDRIIYEWITQGTDLPEGDYFRKIYANKDHSVIDIYHDDYLTKAYKKGNLQDLTHLPTDQILLSRFLAFHEACLLHSLALSYKGNGYLFIGHSGAGKTTMAQIMKPEATILSDDRNIIRKHKDDYRIYGTWRTNELNDISTGSASLKGIFFLNQAKTNKLDQLKDIKPIFYQLMDHLIKSLITPDWMMKSMDFVEQIANDIKCYNLYFDKSGDIKQVINQL